MVVLFRGGRAIGSEVRLKLKLLRDQLRIWNKEVFKKIEVKEAILEDIRTLDLKESSDGLSDDDRTASDIPKHEYERVLFMEKVMWC